jgi:L-alanine-DL-glutamate epimerase-like enolase superfamily enzyme
VGDLERLSGLYDFVNIKLDKTGGLTGALALALAARQRGMGLMLGCMVSTSLAIAPAALLAGFAEFVDLDGAWWLKEDRANPVRYSNGRVILPAAGLWGDAS